MNNTKLIEENNQLRKQLTSLNKKYYEDLLTYIRAKSVFSPEKEVEQILFDILSDMLVAQSNGETAEDYFGKEPKSLADEIIKALPKSFLETVKLVGFNLLEYLILFTIPNITLPSAKFDLGKLIMFALISFIFALGILWLIGQETYQKNKFKKIFSYVMGVLFFLIITLGSVFVKTTLSFSLPGWTGIITILVLFTIATANYVVMRKQQPFLIILYVFIGLNSLIGIGARIPFFTSILSMSFDKTTTLWIFIIIAIFSALVWGLINWWFSKKIKQ